LGSKKRTKSNKKCQFHVAAQSFTSNKDEVIPGVFRGHHTCDKKIDNTWHGYEVCDWHRRFLQDHEIDRLERYQKWEQELDMIEISQSV
jgi:hypothetical protein